MRQPANLAAHAARTVIGAFFVVMTLAFVTVPYALSAHPGEHVPTANAAGQSQSA